MNSLIEAVQEVQEFLKSNECSYMVVGGLAVQVWGKVRMTEDVDVIITLKPEEKTPFIDKLGNQFKLIPDNPLEFLTETNVIPIQTKAGIRVDLILTGTDFERKAITRAKDIIPEAGFSIRVCSPEDLIVMKFISDRPRDREDVEGILLRSGDQMDHEYVRSWLKQFAQALNQPDLIAEYDRYMEKL